MNNQYDCMEIDDLDIMLALQTIKQVCIRNICCECPFGNDAGTTCNIRSDFPNHWEIKEHKIWRAFND